MGPVSLNSKNIEFRKCPLGSPHRENIARFPSVLHQRETIERGWIMRYAPDRLLRSSARIYSDAKLLTAMRERISVAIGTSYQASQPSMSTSRVQISTLRPQFGTAHFQCAREMYGSCILCLSPLCSLSDCSPYNELQLRLHLFTTYMIICHTLSQF